MTRGTLRIGSYLNHHMEQQAGVFQKMSGTPVNILLPNFQTIYQNFICYPPSLHIETQSKINYIIGEEIEKELQMDANKSACFTQQNKASNLQIRNQPSAH